MTHFIAFYLAYTQKKKKQQKNKQQSCITIILDQAITDQFSFIFLTTLGISEWTEGIKKS